MSAGVCRAASLCAPPDPMELLESGDLEGFRAVLAEEGEAAANRVYAAPYHCSLLQAACKRGRQAAFVCVLLESGADPEYSNALREARTALHLAARELNVAALRELLFREGRNGAVANVNAIDAKGFTALHEVCNVKPSEEALACLDVLLSKSDLRINLTTRQGKTAIYLAAVNKNRDAVRRLLKHSALVDVDKIFNGDTARAAILKNFPGVFDDDLKRVPVADKDLQLMDFLYLGDESGFVGAIEEMKRDGAQLRLDIDDGSYTLLQKAAMDGLSLAVEALLNNGANKDKMSARHDTLPTQFAARFAHAEVLRVLLNSGAKVTSPNGKTALHYVIMEADPQSPRFEGYRECFYLLVENSKDDINSADDMGNTPLHLAAKYCGEEFVLSLLKNGAYIGSKNKSGVPPIANISPDTLKKFLDSCVSCKKTPRDPSYKVMFDIQFLKPPTRSSCVDADSVVVPLSETQTSNSVPTDAYSMKPSSEVPPSVNKTPAADTQPAPSTECECEPLLYISKLKDTRHVLKHPVFTSFLDIKWRGLRQFFWINLCIYLLFVCLLTLYILVFFEQNRMMDELDEKDTPAALVESSSSPPNASEHDITSKPLSGSSAADVIWFLSTVMFVIITLRELFQLVVAPKHYVISLENYLEICLLVGSGLVLFYQPADFKIRPHISAITILLSWAELVLLIGKHPRLSTNIEMLKTVSYNFLGFLAWYSLLIMAFALSFYSLFRNSAEEDNFFLDAGSSLFKTVVMVTGEFEAGELPFVMFPYTSHIIFVLFVFLVAIVLFNLLNGLAVSDTQAIREDAELVGIISRIKLISYSEKILLSHPFWCRGCDRGDSCLFQAFTGIRKLSLSRLTAQVQKVRLFPHVLPDGVISVLPNQEREIEFISSGSDYGAAGGCYSPLTCHYYIDSSILKEAEKILASKQSQPPPLSSGCDHVETVKKLEAKIKDLSESARKNQEMLQKVLQLLENSYNSQISK